VNSGCYVSKKTCGVHEKTTGKKVPNKNGGELAGSGGGTPTSQIGCVGKGSRGD